METVEVVVRLPKDVYENIQKIDRIISSRRSGKTIEFALWNGVKNGTVLPKGHGRLVDEKTVYRKFYSQNLAKVAKEVLDDTPAVIEADKVK